MNRGDEDPRYQESYAAVWLFLALVGLAGMGFMFAVVILVLLGGW